ncbi:MAG TPA: ABC transporter permease subunit [Vicinamibacterales bacterium]|nr:ABC transporter permease subunit [Vicinamibacterales bacterium]
MPIHDQGYRRYSGRRGLRGGAWWVIARATILSEMRQRRVIALLLLAWAPFLVRAVLIYAAANFQQASSVIGTTPQTFREFLDWQNVFVFFVTILIGAPLIADDRRANALQIYLAKPLTRVEYIVGKLAVLFAFLAFVTWVPAMLLVLLQVLFAGSLEFLTNNLFILPAITLFSLLQIFVSAFAMLALSSLSPSRRFVAMMYAGIIFFTSAMNTALSRITDSRSWAWISPNDTLDVLADAMFRLATPRAIPVPLAVGAIVVLVAGSMLVLERRVRGVEVVS